MKKDLLTLWDLEPAEIYTLIAEANALKKSGGTNQKLAGKTVALIFEKASTRTKVSFSVAAFRCGAQVINLEPGASQLGRGETYADTGRVLSHYVDGIVLRTFAQERLVELAQAATIPVINGLSDAYHPCQVLADLMTVTEAKGPIEKQVVAWVGDGNNMTHSWMIAAAQLGFELRIATPKGRRPNALLAKKVGQKNNKILFCNDARTAVQGATVINTDTWESMGQETGSDRRSLFAPFQVNGPLLECAKPGAIVLHCLPAHRGDEITDEVMDGSQSRIWLQAANRLPMQEAILLKYLGR